LEEFLHRNIIIPFDVGIRAAKSAIFLVSMLAGAWGIADAASASRPLVAVWEAALRRDGLSVLRSPLSRRL
jgi:hypothetical protein